MGPISSGTFVRFRFEQSTRTASGFPEQTQFFGHGSVGGVVVSFIMLVDAPQKNTRQRKKQHFPKFGDDICLIRS
ncbi:hypothetical protein TNIN_476471 [Trichonephila inaurata madagascariensis]|uniref:Uncharacterized protein n=1 Tax=Trichonephila inaurata madagascariensis TaxID=2747483 RepID=A0A8X6MAM5_9ARAC|nr:hypothetical protein TNIN_19721 [Trichonephila inaurata madagascariensis]GFY60328.1 hypothetical protein TNIN_476471 [Trichonephila inaurata madagascariensis]